MEEEPATCLSSFSILSFFEPFFSNNTLTGLAGNHSPAHNWYTHTARTSHYQIIILFLHFPLLFSPLLFSFLSPISTYPPYQHIPHTLHILSPRILLTHIEYEYPSSFQLFSLLTHSLTHSLSSSFGCFDPFLPIHYILQLTLVPYTHSLSLRHLSFLLLCR